MSDPNVRTLVCPVCNSHVATVDGTFTAHPSADGSGSNCTGTGQSFLDLAQTGSRNYSNGSAFQSCPAATGIPEYIIKGCAHFPDGAHRCAGDREHMFSGDEARPFRTHACTCGFAWSTLQGSVGSLLELIRGPQA